MSQVVALQASKHKVWGLIPKFFFYKVRVEKVINENWSLKTDQSNTDPERKSIEIELNISKNCVIISKLC